MIVSAAKVGYLFRKGVDGVIDVSPFSCMNGIVSEALYPRVSQDCAGIPIRIFYFDGKGKDLTSDLEVFLEMARVYQSRKPYPRRYSAPSSAVTGAVPVGLSQSRTRAWNYRSAVELTAPLARSAQKHCTSVTPDHPAIVRSTSARNARWRARILNVNSTRPSCGANRRLATSCRSISRWANKSE